jgi:F-type H+-transporting ATPase subunit gamma
MAAGKEKELKKRIKSVQSTKKITKAMEMIAASRIVKAEERVSAARPYSEQITEVIRRLAAEGIDVDHPLLNDPDPVRKVGFIAITADRGLAGAYNSSVIRATERALNEERDKGRDYSLVLAGKKGEAYFRFKGYDIDASFSGMSEQPSYDDAKQVAAAVIAPFEEGELDVVHLVYTQFLSAASQRVVVRQFMPLDTEALTEGTEDGGQAAYEFEPGPAEILVRLLPRYVEARLFAAMLEAAASEHAARQRAMKAATENAEDLITSLSREMNRARQETITTEIMEIVGGAEALRGAQGSEEDVLPDVLVASDFLPDDLIRH